jgi:integrase
MWFFVYSIPKDLRGRPPFVTSSGAPKDKIVESTGTADPEKAKDIRDQRIVHWNRRFRAMRLGPTDDDILAEAFEIYRRTRQAMEEHYAAEPPSGPPDPELERAEREQYLRQLDEAIARVAADDVANYSARIGLRIEPGSDLYRKIGTEFLRAIYAGQQRESDLPTPPPHMKVAQQLFAPPTSPATSAPSRSDYRAGGLPIASSKGAETFSEAFGAYITTELNGTSAGSIADYRNRVKVFIDKYGDLPLRQITGEIAVEFLDQYMLAERKVSPRTRNSYASLFAAVFRSAIRRRKVSTNPFADQLIRAETVHYEPYTDSEIAKLLSGLKLEIKPAAHTTMTAGAWVTLIAAFSGARLEEAAQLRAADIKQTDGVWHFEFAANGNGKTRAATRSVPLHQVLIDAGLLKYRDGLPSDGPLFPGLRARASKGKLGAAIGDWYNGFRKTLGVDRQGLNFHSWRHTVGDRLRRAGVPEDDLAALLGHEHPNLTSGTYAHNGPGLKRLASIVAKLEYGWRP